MKITLVTTGRADYGLLSPLIQAIRGEARLTLEIVATGGHLVEAQGGTIRFIQADGHAVTSIPMTPEVDSEDGICRAVAAGLSGFSSHFARLRPDLVLVLGDRFELWAVCMAAVLHKIPIAHLHGGETTLGAIDDTIRHTVTKMATWHFPALPEYARVILAMGEHPERVHVVGALGIDAIVNTPPLEPAELTALTGIDFAVNPVALLTYHPVTLDDHAEAARQTATILEALTGTDLTTLITMPNLDAGGAAIRSTLERHCLTHPERFRLVKSLGQRGYLTAMRHAALMIGNSSSGILEAASFRLPVINIGDRQAGRIRAGHVLDCPCEAGAIRQALGTARSAAFRASLATLVNPYGDGCTAPRIVRILAGLDLSARADLLKKGFHAFSGALPR
ncbi:UDP-N-acetylglucosamine 2-epimerase [Candidatus Magnetaquiglobus chichijimensis]|uniref:UDP-N-acetylglucosamine 2-epimerase n=1 Tax=Candidatus Magnetaquiglobus chichijimensis TaxID=3141448 RepID=UPI003B97AF5A